MDKKTNAVPAIQLKDLYLDIRSSLFLQVTEKPQSQAIARSALSNMEENIQSIVQPHKKENSQPAAQSAFSFENENKEQALTQASSRQLEIIEIKTPNKQNVVDFYEFLLKLKGQGYKTIEIEIETGNCNFN
jgi:Zn-dependent metalloprotease